MSALLPSVITGVFGIGSDIMNNAYQQRAAAQQREFQREMAAYSYQKDLDMWKLSNEYNSPAAQMQRFKSAGLNPNLMYGQGNAGNVATSMPKYQQYGTPVAAPEFTHGFGIANVISTYQDLRIKDAQLDLLKKQIENKSVENWYQSGFLQEKLSLLEGKRAQQDYLMDPEKLPFMRRYQAETQSIENRNLLNKLDIGLKKMGATWQDSLLLRLYMSGQHSNSELLKYSLMDFSKNLPKIGFGFGKLNFRPKSLPKVPFNSGRGIQPNYNF